MNEPVSDEFDRLAAATRSGTMEANNALWSATFALPHWWFLPDGDPPRIRTGVLNGRAYVLAFTSGERARKQAVAWGLADPDGSVNVLAASPHSTLSMVDRLVGSGVFGIVFDHGISGYYAPLANLRPIYEHVRELIPQERPAGGWYAIYRGTEYRADLLDDGLVELLGPGPDFSFDEAGRPFLRVSRADLDELYAVNLTAQIGTSQCAVLTTVADRIRMMTAEPDHAAGPAWHPMDHGVYETVVSRSAVELTGLRVDLPLEHDPPLLMQKVLTPEQARSCFRTRLPQVYGYVAPLEEVAQWETPEDIVEGLRLEYVGSPFSRYDHSIAVLRFALRDGTWRLSPAAEPQHFIGPRHVMPMPVGAELLLLDRTGERRVAMRYAGTRIGWQRLA